MRYLILILFVFPAVVHAADFEFFSSVGSILESIWVFISVDIPSFFVRLQLFIIKYIVLAKLNTLIFTTEFAYSIATEFLQSLNMTQVINQSIARLDSDIVQTLVDVRFFDALQLVIEAFLTRFILDMMGW